MALLRKLELDAFGAQEVRQDQARYIRKHLPGFAYVGDFRNKDRKHGEASPIFYRKDRLEAEKSGTFWLSKTPDVPGSKGWDARYPRIDFIYVSPGVTVKSYATHADPRLGIEYYPSDHFPVTADIEL